jgi:hypothetical protein
MLAAKEAWYPTIGTRGKIDAARFLPLDDAVLRSLEEKHLF